MAFIEIGSDDFGRWHKVGALSRSTQHKPTQPSPQLRSSCSVVTSAYMRNIAAVSRACAALRYVAVVPLALLVAACGAVWEEWEENHSVSYFDWGIPRTENIRMLNAVAVVQGFDGATGTMTYFTGGRDTDSGGQFATALRNQAAPVRVIAAETVGEVTVRVRAVDDRSAHEYRQYASWLARTIHLATTELWPAATVPVIVDVYVMGEDVPYSWARRIAWTDGDPLRVVIFRRSLDTIYPSAAHELYHLLSARWSIGWSGSGASTNSTLAAYEEVVAHLYARCAALLANGSLSSLGNDYDVTLNGRRMQFPPLNHSDLEYMLDLLARSEQDPQDNRRAIQQLGVVLQEIPIIEALGEQSEISLDSPPGRELVARCRDVSADPVRVENWFAALLSGVN